ncbi:MAG TPA: nitrilase-related carbon-nitrogen hydrolase [Acidobacteriaceae bacterium]|nr:nitrilase-related carbon-nitrogen hydrolase [Acidobacteriaceae bacterium]
MEYGNRAKGVAIALAAFVATAALLYFGNGLMPRWPLMWLAPLPVLVFALRRPAWQAGVVAAATWMAGGLNLWGYLRVLQAPPVVWFADFGSAAVAFAAGVLLMQALARRGAVWSAWLALPAVWVAFEFARNLWLWPHGSAACIAYSQLNFLPFLQLASLGGPWGMGFVLMLFPTGLALAIHRRGSPQATRVLGATVGVAAATLIFGAVRLAIPQSGPEVTVGLIASDANGGSPVNEPGAPTQRLLAQYAARAQQLIAQGAKVVVMPEDMGVALDSDVASVDATFQPIADQTGAVLVVGMARIGATGEHNEARIYTLHAAVRTYNKEHLLPPWETSHFTPGGARTLFSPPQSGMGRTWGVAICKDMDFTNPARAYGRAGVGLMLVPAWDFNVDRFWHGHIALMRAVEDGFSLVRSARGGFLTVADDRGRILAETRSNSAPFATLLAKVPAGHSGTVFLLLGDWFGWCAMALAVPSLARLAIRRQG